MWVIKMVPISKLVMQVVIIIISLYIIRIFRIPPGVISGNGNPQLVVIIPLVIVLFWFGLTWFKWLRSLKLSTLIRLLIMIVSLVVIVSGIMQISQAFKDFEVQYKENFEKKYGYPVESDYFEQISNGINFHTNYLYFNYTTFFILVSVLNIIAIGSSILRPPK